MRYSALANLQPNRQHSDTPIVQRHSPPAHPIHEERRAKKQFRHQLQERPKIGAACAVRAILFDYCLQLNVIL